MKRYLIIKIGGSNLMVDLIIQALNQFVYVESDEVPSSVNYGTVLMFSFLSQHTIDEITSGLYGFRVNNFTVTEIDDNNFRSQLSEKVNFELKLISDRYCNGKNLDDMDINELRHELDLALQHEIYERASLIRDKMNLKLN